MAERYYLVELRCGTCGLIFISSSGLVPSGKVADYQNMFREKGPERFVQCKNRCPRWRATEQRPIESPWRAPLNTNQEVIVTLIPNEELRAHGLMA